MKALLLFCAISSTAAEAAFCIKASKSSTNQEIRQEHEQTSATLSRLEGKADKLQTDISQLKDEVNKLQTAIGSLTTSVQTSLQLITGMVTAQQRKNEAEAQALILAGKEPAARRIAENAEIMRGLLLRKDLTPGFYFMQFETSCGVFPSESGPDREKLVEAWKASVRREVPGFLDISWEKQKRFDELK